MVALPQFESVEAVHVRVPFKQPFTTAHGAFTTRSSWIVLMRDREGREGFGEIALEPWASATDESTLGHGVREVVDLLTEDREPDWSAGGSRSRIKRAVRAGFEGALEGLTTHHAADSLSVAVNATLDFRSPAESAAAAVEAVKDGFTTLKVKVVGDEPVEALVARVTAIRDAVGRDVRLRLDVNGSWNFDTALARLGALRTLGIEYVEQPLPASDLDGHAALRKVRAVPIALDESVEDELAVRRILDTGAAALLVVKPARVGGPVVARAIAARAADAGVPSVLSTYFETGVGIAAALRIAATLPRVGEEHAHGLATAGLLEHDLLATSMTIAGGRLSLPPGLALDAEAVDRYAVGRIGQTQ